MVALMEFHLVDEWVASMVDMWVVWMAFSMVGALAYESEFAKAVAMAVCWEYEWVVMKEIGLVVLW
eukprot:CAMPEP_0170130244 /NCGR_PEP_ID=MMETSP0020_2-20130122/22465_1 /TAXON_ID=98059 /ORGANISM="Dinobryon sp., Strain UTEXLB2267" /LENGTH=65 /DNA_ID=CAMNT_0010364947 /DNA_START=249 /DNA_END=443 /DNA_ORIENTATION=-